MRGYAYGIEKTTPMPLSSWKSEMMILTFTPMSEALRESLAKSLAHLPLRGLDRAIFARAPLPDALTRSPPSLATAAAASSSRARMGALPRQQRTSMRTRKPRRRQATTTTGRKVRKLEPPHSSHSLPAPPPK